AMRPAPGRAAGAASTNLPATPAAPGRRPARRRTGAAPPRSPRRDPPAAAAAARAITVSHRAASGNLIAAIARGSKQLAKRPPPLAKRRRPGALPLERREVAGALRRPDELDELRAVAELVAAARGADDAQHVVVVQRPVILAAAQQLGERRHADREARVLGRRGEAGELGAAIDRGRDQPADVRLGQFVTDPDEPELAVAGR